MKKISIIGLILLSVVGCSPPKEITVVDGEGDPVEGALVVSDKPAYFSRWRTAIYVTDETGKAKVVTDRGYVLKPGYFPLIESSELEDGVLWRPFLLWRSSSDFGKTTPIYPIRPEESIPVDHSRFGATTPKEGGTVVVPTEVCQSTSSVVYSTESSQFLVESENEDLIPSQRFYFVGPSGEQSVSQIRGENNVAFYCKDGSDTYKIGMSVSGKGGTGGQTTHGITIFTASVPSTGAYLQPEVKCMTERHVGLAPDPPRADEAKPKLYTSPTIKGQIGTFRDNIPCANQYSDEFFDKIEVFL